MCMCVCVYKSIYYLQRLHNSTGISKYISKVWTLFTSCYSKVSLRKFNKIFVDFFTC